MSDVTGLSACAWVAGRRYGTQSPWWTPWHVIVDVIQHRTKHEHFETMSSLALGEDASAPAPGSVSAKILAAEEYKGKGNEAFLAGKFKKAIRNYNFVFAYVTGLPGQSPGGQAGDMSSMLRVSQEEQNNA